MSTQDGMKYPEMHKNSESGENNLEVKKRGPATDRQLDDMTEWQVESLFAEARRD